ncbi:MAG TPA: acylphosphatase [Candidatus Limnocylindria bacterium]|nr:acylphosphatase [Candidatus Limnocylindria bacterium]
MARDRATVTSGQRLTARVIGRVQGVGYRWWVVQRASALGLVGWVRNADDERSVELVAEGDANALDAFEAELTAGPGGARVDAVEASRGSASGGWVRFEIRR